MEIVWICIINMNLELHLLILAFYACESTFQKKKQPTKTRFQSY